MHNTLKGIRSQVKYTTKHTNYVPVFILTGGAMPGIVSVTFTECVPMARGQDNPASFATSQRLRVSSTTVIISHFTFTAIDPFVTTSAVNNTCKQYM